MINPFKSLRLFLKAMKTRWGRLQLRAVFVRNIPGEYGIAVRSRAFGRYFGYAGKNLRIYEGFKFRNLHKVLVGDNVVIGIDNFFQGGGGIEIGSETVLSPGVKIWTQNQKCDSLREPYRVQGLEYLKAKIGENVWVGPNVFIMPGTDIGDGCMITAGSLVDRGEYPPYAIVSGNPARVVGTRLSGDSGTVQKENIPGIARQVPPGNLTLTSIPE